MHSESTIEKAWKTMMKRLHAPDQFGSSFWSKPQPAFRRCEDGSCVLDLLYGSRTTYDAGINNGTDYNYSTNSSFAITLKLKEKLPAYGKKWYCATMRMYKRLPNIEFKRIWLETAVGHELYKLGAHHCDGKPFMKASDTIESLAMEYDLASAVK